MSHNISSNTPTILAFSKAHQRRIWDSQKHRKTSLAKMVAFSEFSDYSTLPIDQYSPSHIYDFLEYREDFLHNRPATLNRYTAALNKVFKFYHAEIKSGTPPALKWRREAGGRPRSFTLKEQTDLTDIFINGPHPWTAHIATLLLRTGMRTSEVVNIGLTSDEVGEEETYGQISQDMSSVMLFRTKNGSEREVPLCLEARRALEGLNFRPSTFFNHHDWYEDWRRARRIIAPDDVHFVPHVCRHTAGTNLAIKGWNMAMIGFLLGHKSIVTTAKYIHEDKATLRKMVESL